MYCAAKLGLTGKGRGAFLQRGFSARKAARSDYEEQQMLLGLKAVEKMKQMVLVRCGCKNRAQVCLTQCILFDLQHSYKCACVQCLTAGYSSFPRRIMHAFLF